MNHQEHTLQVKCPIDKVEARVSLDGKGGFQCSHACEISEACPSRCSARAVLADPDEPVRMQIVCPRDLHFARIVTQGGEVTWCSHEHSVEDCKRDCLTCAQD